MVIKNMDKLTQAKKKYIQTSKKKIIEMIDILTNYYPDVTGGLNFNEPIELVVGLILAAQCTDIRVNKTTPILFAKYPDVYALSKANINDISNIIKSCGFYNTKAKSIYETANIIVNNFSGIVPNTMDKLCTLKGIGRKSSNIILQECFNITVGIAVDTHVTRIARKTGISNANTADKIEIDLIKKIDKKYWPKINHILVVHGRQICIARRPKCDICPINHICPKND
jgi:endonuclease-3